MCFQSGRSIMKKLEEYKWICPDAFVGVNTNVDGSWTPCCAITMKAEKNIKSGDTYDDFHNSSQMKKLRRAFKNQDLNYLKKTCKECIKSEKYNVESLRQVSLNKYNNELKNKKSELENIIETDCKPTFLQSPLLMSLGQGICNLKCGMCVDFLSSARKQESMQLGEIDETYPSSKVNHPKKFEKDLDWILNKCVEFPMPMAEPLLVKKSFDILNRLNKNKNVLVTTNGTINVDKFIQHAKDFKYVNIAVSIEGGKDVNTYIRYPSNWDTILQNFDKLSEYKNFEVVFNSTMNALNVGKFTKMRKDIAKRKWRVGNVIRNNAPWEVSSIPDDVREIYLNDLYEFGEQSIINLIENRVYNEKNMIELMQHCKRRDNLRGTYLPGVFPEWKKYYEEA